MSEDSKPYISYRSLAQPELRLGFSQAEKKDYLLRKKVADWKRGIVRNARTKGKRLGILYMRNLSWLDSR